jgi:HK97 family phage major capsid protein
MDALIARDLTNAGLAMSDGTLLDPTNAGDQYTPAAVTNGISTTHVSSGSTLSAIDADLKLLLADLVEAGSSLLNAVWVMGPQTAIHLSLLRGTGGDLAYGVSVKGGFLAGLPVLVTANVAETGSPLHRSITLIDSDDFVWTDAGFAISKSSQTTIEMSNTPTGNTVTPAAMTNSMVSLFQAEATAIKVVRAVNWRMRRPTVSVLTGVEF